MPEPSPVECMIEDARWDSTDLERVANGAASAVLAHLRLAPEGFEIALLACDDARSATLNTHFRDKAQPTNVLSWPAVELGADIAGEAPMRPKPGTPEAPAHLGDIALAYETCVREADEQGKALHDHLAHLIVHAVLHLLGYDHQEDTDAELMELIEISILATLGVENPYAEGLELPR